MLAIVTFTYLDVYTESVNVNNGHTNLKYKLCYFYKLDCCCNIKWAKNILCLKLYL